MYATRNDKGPPRLWDARTITTDRKFCRVLLFSLGSHTDPRPAWAEVRRMLGWDTHYRQWRM